jgi:hypothetical protein
MSEVQDAQYVWMDGELVARADAKLPQWRTPTYHKVPEAVRAYSMAVDTMTIKVSKAIIT